MAWGRVAGRNYSKLLPDCKTKLHKNRTTQQILVLASNALLATTAQSSSGRCQTANHLEVATLYARVLHTSHAQLDARAHEAP